MAEKTFNWVYILEVSNGNYYTGYTTNIKKRIWAHFTGQGAKFTKAFKPKKVLRCWKIYGPKNLAMKTECFIKNLTRAEKNSLLQKPENLLALLANFELKL